jgi:hypothetical protein
MGYSMGGFQTLFLAAQSATNDASLCSNLSVMSPSMRRFVCDML